MKHAYCVLDVFTDTRLHGNPLAVVFDADGLEPDVMQAVAREFNLSETVFVLSPRDPVNSARIRIFTPARELPFAGHPTVGAAVVLAERRAAEIIARQDLSVVIEEEVGLVSCIVRRHRGSTRASFTLPRLPVFGEGAPTPAAAAAALGLATADLQGAGVPMAVSAGVPYVLVPVPDRAVLARAWPDLGLWEATFGEHGVFVYTRAAGGGDVQVQARMFAPQFGIAEDPATGSAVAALAGVIARDDALADGDHTVVITQGVEMGRPSLIVLGLSIEGGQLVSASVGGAAVTVAEGTLHL